MENTETNAITSSLPTSTESQTPALFDGLRSTLGTGDMSMDEMVTEMRMIRETSDYDAPPLNA